MINKSSHSIGRYDMVHGVYIYCGLGMDFSYFSSVWVAMYLYMLDLFFVHIFIINFVHSRKWTSPYQLEGNQYRSVILRPPWAGVRKRIGPPLPCVSYEATKRGHLRSIDALVTSKSVYTRCLPWLEWVSQKLISAVLVLYAVSVMDGHSKML